MIRKFFLVSALFLMFSYGSKAEKVGEFTVKHTPETYDSLVSAWQTQNQVNWFENFTTEFIQIDTTLNYTSDIPDSVYIARLRNIMSPIHLPYNDVVRKYIVAYTTKHQKLLGQVMGLSQYYFPIIEQELDCKSLPLEFKYLPIIESALTPTAGSHAGAVGLWQFMLTTGRHYGLEISSFVDQRRDPVLSTQAAAKYLKDLYKIYGDWALVLAAYNCGPGNLNKALKRAGSNAKTYWDIYPFLPKETRGFVPSFVAVNYAFKYFREHQIEPIAPPMPISADTLIISRPIHLEQISSTISTPIEVLKLLNPQFKSDIIPATERSYSLVMPQSDIAQFIEKESEIYAKDSIYLAKYMTSAKKIDLKFAEATSYKIKSGDTLGGIAKRNRVTVSQLMKWNNIKNPNNLSVGKVLVINK